MLDGVSWGSSLALAYAQAHPDRVLAVVPIAVTAGTRGEIDWITETVGRVFPEEWDRFAAFAEESGIGPGLFAQMSSLEGIPGILIHGRREHQRTGSDRLGPASGLARQ